MDLTERQIRWDPRILCLVDKEHYTCGIDHLGETLEKAARVRADSLVTGWALKRPCVYCDERSSSHESIGSEGQRVPQL